MRISAITANYAANKGIKKTSLRNSRVEAPTEKPPIIPKGMTMISFKSGNPDHIGIWGAELPPYNKVGGVATVGEDYRALKVSDNYPIPDKKSFEYYRQKNKYFANPIYNSSLNYNDGILTGVEVAKIPTGLSETSAFKPYEGKYFMTNNQNFRKYLNPRQFFEKEDKIIEATGKPNLTLDGNVFILEDVTGGKRMMDFGDTGESEIKLYQTLRMNKETGNLEPIHDFHVWVDLTATMPKPYANGSYSSSPRPLGQSWQGNAYAKAAKAYDEFMERITELTSVDPATIHLNDMQAAPVINYMAEKVANGDSFRQGKHAALVTHNTQEAYIERSSNLNMFVDIADKELREAVDKDPKFAEAAKQGSGAIEAYFRELLPDELFDKQGIASQFMIGAYYANQGYLPQITGVSEKYIEKAATDPDFIPALYETLNKLYQEGKLDGINNAFENEGLNPYTLPGMVGYNTEVVLGKTATSEGFKLKPFRAYDKELFNENNVDMNHVNEVRRENAINLMERFNPELLSTLKELKNVSGHEYDLNIAVAGLPDKSVDVYGYIDPKFVEAAKAGEDVKIVTSIGRGDKQKAFDTVLEAFEKYVIEYGEQDPYTVLIMGGDFDVNSEEGKKIIKVLNRMEANPLIKGRYALNRGFSPNKPFFLAGTVAPLPSRFAPFELTDLEAMKVGCTPLVPNGQGMAQKNFDTAFDGEAEKATSYKTPHEYEMPLDTIKENLSEEDNAKLQKELDTFYKGLKDEYYLTHNGNVLSDEACMAMIMGSAALLYTYKDVLLRPYRDKIMASEFASSMKRALIENRGKEEEKLRIQNQLKQYTEWERNGKLSKTGESSAERYRKLHFQRQAGKITKDETLLGKLKKNCASVYERTKAASNTTSTSSASSGTSAAEKSWWTKLVDGVKKNKKAVGITAGAVGLVGLGYAGYKAGWFSSKFQEEKKNGNLSCVG